MGFGIIMEPQNMVKKKIVLYRYRQFHCIHENWWYVEMLIWNADVETRFETSNYELDRPLPKGKVKKVIAEERMNCIRKDELGVEIMKKILGLRVKTVKK